MEIAIFEINAFTEKAFGGNPAAVCPLDNFLPGQIMQSIAAQNNLDETAFIVNKNGHYLIRFPAFEEPALLAGDIKDFV